MIMIMTLVFMHGSFFTSYIDYDDNDDSRCNLLAWPNFDKMFGGGSGSGADVHAALGAAEDADDAAGGPEPREE